MKSNRLYLIAALSPILAVAAAGQAPAPPPSPTPRPMAQMLLGSPATRSSRVSAVIYGPDGEVQAFTLRNGVAVTLAPDLGMRLQSNVTKGVRVQVSGMERVVAGQATLVAQSVTANGQIFVAVAPLANRGPGLGGETPPPPPAGPIEARGPRTRREPGAPPPPDRAVPLPSPPTGANVPPPPPPPDGAAPLPPPAGTPPSPPQM